MRMRALAPYGVIVVAAILLDQWVKILVETRLTFQQPVEILPFLALFRTHNTGIAFSMLSSSGDTGLIVITLAVVAFVLYLAWRTGRGQIFARIGFALVIGGALGNLVDRVTLGYVVDYLLFHTPVWSFAVFNLADAFITIGAGLVILEEVLAWRREASGKS